VLGLDVPNAIFCRRANERVRLPFLMQSRNRNPHRPFPAEEVVTLEDGMKEFVAAIVLLPGQPCEKLVAKAELKNRKNNKVAQLVS
jgi:hypothetical protein